MLPVAEMDQNVLGTLEDNINIDDNIFNLNLDFGNAGVSPNDQDNCFKWVDEFISSTELEEPSESTSNGPITSTSQPASVGVQQITAVQQQQQLLQNAVLQQQPQTQQPPQQQQQTHSLGNVIMAMGQPSQTQNMAVAPSASASQPQLLQNQTTILQSNLAGQQLGSPFILKTSSGTPLQLAQTPVTQSTSNISANPQQFLASAGALMSCSLTPSQSSSPLLSRSMTPSHTLTTVSRPSSVGQPQVSVSTPSNLNLLQLQQSQQITQQVQLSNFVTGQPNLQGHTVLTAQGSNIVHTQNALIQNPNVVNVNVAHVLPNQLPPLQGTIVQTPQGNKILIQPNNQQLPQQLTLSNLGQMAGGQAVQMAPGVGLGQPAVIAQQPGNVNLANSGGVTQQQPSFNLINLGGSQGHVLVQRMPTSGGNVQATPTQALAQGPILLRTVNGQQQLLQQQPALQSATSVGLATTQLSQQLVGQAGSTQQIPLQQFLAGSGGQSLRLVGQPTTATAQQPAATSTVASNNVVLQPVIAANQNLRLVGQQTTQKKGKLPQGADQRRLAMAGTKPGTVTLNLAGQNLSLQQLQNLPGLQLTQTQNKQQIVVQQPQQQLTASATAIQQTVVQTATQQVTPVASSKKSKSKNCASASSSTVSLGSLSAASTPVSSDAGSADIMTAALMSCGISEEDGLDIARLNGGDFTDFTSQVVAASTQLVTATPTQTQTPTPPPPPTSKSKKKSKKKKETSTVVEQPVVLSSTTAKAAITITTASASVVTTTISQSTVSLAGQPMAANTYTFSSSAANIAMATGNATVTTTASQPIGIPAVAMTSTSPATVTGGVQATTLTPVRGRQGGPNAVKQIAGVQNLSLQDRQELLQVQQAMSKLKEKGTLDEKAQAQLRELDAKRKKIFNQAHLQIMAAFKQQQQQQQQQQQEQGGTQMSQVTIQGQQLTVQGQTVQGSVQAEQSTQSITLSPCVVGQQQPPSSQSPQLKQDVKPVLGTPSTPFLHIQPKSNAKLKLVSPKQEPGAVQPVTLQDTKPLAMASGDVMTSLSSTQLPSGSTFQTTAGNVIMTMSTPPNGGQAGSNPPQMLRIQIGGQKAQPVGVAAAAVTAATTQQLVLQSSQKIVMAANVTATTVSSVMTASPSVASVSTGPSATTARPTGQDIARPVQIKIANQVLTLQLTQSQQEKLELHLSRMPLEQQQAFLQTQHHILTKLQLRAESNTTTPQTAATATTLQGTAGGTGIQGASAMAPTVVAAVAAKNESVAKNLQVMGSTSGLVTATPQQLPITVQQALENSQVTANSKQTPSASAAPAAAPVSRASLEIPKASMIHSQLGKDQEHAIAPDIKTPFKDYREAQRRLLRFHVFQHKNVTQEFFDNFDTDFDSMCEDLIEKKDAMFAKYRHLLLEDSMRRYATSEQVLIHRMWCNDMQMLIRHDKQLAEKDPDNFVPMPTDYLEKDLTQEEPEESEDYAEEYDSEEEEETSEREEEEASRNAEGDDSMNAYNGDDAEGVHGGGEASLLEESSSPCYPYENSGELVPQPADGEEGDPSLDNEEELEESLLKDSYSSVNDSFEASSPPSHPHEDSSKEASPHREVSPVRRQLSSPVPEPSRSPRSSPPQPEPPPRTLVKLVIRNDGKGFTSKVVERRRSSVKAERRLLRTRSHSGHEREEVRKEKEVKKEPVTEEIEYIDVDNSKYNRGVSVTLERLPDKTSQEYGLSISNKTPANSCANSQSGNALHRTSDDENKKCSASGSKSISSKSGRKRRRGEGERRDEGEGVHIKRERHYSGVSGSSCDERGDAAFRDVKETKPAFSDSPVREFYVGSAMEPLDHFDSDDDGKPYLADMDSLNQGAGDSGLLKEGLGHSSRPRPVCSSPIMPVSSSHSLAHTSSLGDNTHTTDSLHEPHSAADYLLSQEQGNEPLGDGHRQSFSQPDQEGELDFEEYIPESPIDGHEMQPPPFPGQIPAGLIQTDSMFDTSPGHEMESSFELDNPDPQGSMVNRQVQSAIDSILNGSSSSGSDGRRARSRSRSGGLPLYPSGTADDTSLDYDVGRPSHHGNGRQASEPHTSCWDEEDSEHDLDAAVQSILR